MKEAPKNKQVLKAAVQARDLANAIKSGATGAEESPAPTQEANALGDWLDEDIDMTPPALRPNFARVAACIGLSAPIYMCTYKDVCTTYIHFGV